MERQRAEGFRAERDGSRTGGPARCARAISGTTFTDALLNLQRVAGNRSVAGLLAQRQRVPGATGLAVTIQRYETGEHALIGGGPNYPMVNPGEIRLPNGAHATPGELVAFGDFYVDLDQMARMPRQETEALVGFTRLEALWYQARRKKSQHAAHGGGPHPPGADPTPLDVFPEITGNDTIWSALAPDKRTLMDHRRAIYEQFRPAFAFFEISFSESEKPPSNIVSLKATLGRRRFREKNDTLYGVSQQSRQDPARMGGDFVDLASQNVSHFTPDNFATWAAEHEKACADYRAGQKSTALARDALGLHYLTDRFSAGHLVNKEELMAYATNLIVGVAERHGHPKGSKHAKIKALLKDALNACFKDPSLKKEWDLGCQDAYKQGLITQGDFDLLTHLGTGVLPSVPDNILEVVMSMPWRNVRGEVTLDAGSRSFGPESAKESHGDYQLGVGNLAAKQVHDALNAIGFHIRTGDGKSWRMQGDDHLTVEALTHAHRVVEVSQRQVTKGRSDVEAIRRLMPQRASMDGQAIREYFESGARPTFDQTRVDELITRANRLVIPLSTDAPIGKPGNEAMSPEITEVCHRLMEIIFLPAGSPGRTDAASLRTGVNIASLTAFLHAHLREMVPMTYAVAHPADLPQRAQEAYAPYAFDARGAGRRLPVAANDFRLSGRKVSFNLNVTGCAPGTYTIGYRVFDRDIDYDTTPLGQHKTAGVSNRYGDAVDAIANARDIEDTDEVQESGTATVVVPSGAGPTAQAGGRTLLWVTIDSPAMGAGRFRDFWRDNYLMVYADAGHRMAIGRSPSRNDTGSGWGNQHPTEVDPRVTGADRTASPPTLLQARRALDFTWSGKTLRFKVEPKGVPLVYITFYDKDLGYDYDKRGHQLPGVHDTDEPLGVYTVKPAADGTASVTVSGDADDPWDSYAVAYADTAKRVPLGRSDTQPRW